MVRGYDETDVKFRLIKVLHSSKSGISGVEISEKLGINRVTMSKYLNKFAAEGTITQKNIGNLNLWFVDDDIEQLNFPEDYFIVQEKFLLNVIECVEKPVYNLIKNCINSKQSFETFFDVENDFSRMLHLIRNPCPPKRNEQSEKIGIDLSTLKDNREQLCLMRPSDLNAIAKILENSDITNMIVSEPICSLIGDAVPQPLVDEYYFSMEAIGETLIPGIDIEGSKWFVLKKGKYDGFNGSFKVNGKHNDFNSVTLFWITLLQLLSLIHI